MANDKNSLNQVFTNLSNKELDKRLGEIEDRESQADLEARTSSLRSRLGRGIISGATQAATGIPHALAIAQGAFSEDGEVPLTERTLFKAGESLQSFVDEDILELTPEERASFGTKVGQGLGQVAGLALPGGLLGKAGTAGRAVGHGVGITSGVGMAGHEGTQDYIATRKSQGKEIDPQELQDVAFANSLRGVLEYITPAKGLKALEGISPGVIQTLTSKSGLRSVKRGGGKSKLAQVGKEGLKGLTREGAQEAFDQLALNAIAKGYVEYDPERGLFKDVKESAEVGGTVGAIFNATMGALGLRARGRFEQVVQEQIESGVEGARQATQGAPEINPETGIEYETATIGKAAKRIGVFNGLLDEAVQRGAQEGIRDGYRGRVEGIVNDLEGKYLEKEGADPVARSEAKALIDSIRGEGYSDNKISEIQKAAEAEKAPKKEEKQEASEIKEEDIVTPVDETPLEDVQDLSPRKFASWLNENKIDQSDVTELRSAPKDSEAYQTYLDMVDSFRNNEAFQPVDEVVEEAPSRAEEVAELIESGAPQSEIDAVLAETTVEELNEEAQETVTEIPQAGDTSVDQLSQEQQEAEVSTIETEDSLDRRAQAVAEESVERIQTTLSPVTEVEAALPAEDSIAPSSEVAPTVDVVKKDGKPFVGKGPAKAAATKAEKATGTSHEAVELPEGGWVARPTQEATKAPDTSPAVEAPVVVEENIKEDLREADEAGDLSPREDQTTAPFDSVSEMSREVSQSSPSIEEAQGELTPEDRIEDINKELQLLEEQLIEYEIDERNPQVLEAKVRSLSAERGRLHRKANDQISKVEEDEAVLAEREGAGDVDSIILDDLDMSVFPTNVFTYTGDQFEYLPLTDQQLGENKKAFDKFVGSISDEILLASQIDPKSLNFHWVERIGDIKDSELRKRLLNTYRKSSASVGPGGYPRALIYPDGTNTHIYVIGRAQHSPKTVQASLLHEFIGHFGMRSLFGESFDSFLNKSLSNTPNLMDVAYKVVVQGRGYQRYRDLGPKFDKRGNPQPTIKLRVQGITRDVDAFTARKVLEEYIAAQSEDLAREDIVNQQAGRKGFFKRLVAWVRHKLRSFGVGVGRREYALTHDDIMGLLSEAHSKFMDGSRFASASNIYAKSPTEFKQRIETEGDVMYVSAEGEVTSTDFFGNPTEIDNEIMFSQDESLNEFSNTTLPADYGQLNKSWWSQNVDRVMRRIRYNKFINHFTPMGNMPAEKHYDTLGAKSKGAISKGDFLIRRLKKVFKAHQDPAIKAKMYKYFTTRGANIESVEGLNVVERKLLEQGKQNIEELGQAFVDLGILSSEVYEQNKGAYLPARYLKYIETYAGGGKRPSFMNYLKKQNPDITEADKVALGRIQDPEFLVIETIATMSRDSALLNMFKAIEQNSKTEKLFWVLKDEAVTQVGNRPVPLVDIEDMITHYSQLISDGVGGVYNFTLEEQSQLENFRDQAVLAQQKGLAEFQSSVREAMIARGTSPDEITPEDLDAFLHQDYNKMPNDYVYGALRGRYIRKEIHQDIVDTYETNQVDKNSSFSRWFSPGGHVETAHQFWKFMKVPANIPSWFRNGISNGVLLDISSKTNSAKLSSMVFKTFNTLLKGDPYQFRDSAIKGTEKDPYRYARLAVENGLFGTTYSAQELYLTQQTYLDEAKRRMSKAEFADQKHGFLKKSLQNAMWFTQEKFYVMSDIANNAYGGLEGIFKTTALQDYIETWEAQNDQKIDNLEEVQRQRIIDEAVHHANEAIFDYSKVPNFIRMMRRYPIGAPFLTFTYKALPAIIKGTAYHPQKMIKYAMFPYLMAQMFLASNDLEEEDLEEIRRKMPTWMKDKGSVYLLPWKDANDNWQAMDFGYYFPWEVFQSYGLHVKNHFDSTRPGMSTLEMGKDALTHLGFASGPLPTTLNAFLTNKDDFTGREIVTVGAPQSQQFNELFGFLHTMWAPSWISQQGFTGKLMDEFGIEKTPFNSGRNVDRFGNERSTPGQAVGRLVGANVFSLDPEVTARQNLVGFRAQMGKLTKARSKTMKDRNLSSESKARLLKDHNEQIKRLRQKQQQSLRGE